MRTFLASFLRNTAKYRELNDTHPQNLLTFRPLAHILRANSSGLNLTSLCRSFANSKKVSLTIRNSDSVETYFSDLQKESTS